MEDSAFAAEEEPGCFVRVTGISRETTEDALLNFFLNTRRSGGGKIKDSQLKLEEGVADITFMTSEVAERVVQKENLIFDGAKLNATLITDRKNLPTDKRSVHVKGISDRTTRDGLMTYMEVVSGEEVENVYFGDSCNAMVIFKDPPDFEKLSNMCSKKTLDGKNLQIEQVNMCDCIEVTGLSPKTTKDAVLYYFENSRNGGGVVRKLDYDKEAGRAVVFFDDPSDVDNVLTKLDHAIDDAHLTINRYYTFLGEISFTNPSGRKKDKVIKVYPKNMLLIKKRFSQEFEQLLQDRRVKYTWQQGSGEIVLGCADPKMDKKTWENSCEAVVGYINQIVTEKITISREVWKQLSDEAKEKCAVFENQISILHAFDFETKENSILLRGKETDVSDLAKQLHDLISLVGEQIMIEKSKISKKIEISDVQIDLMSASGFVDGLKTRHEGIDVTVNRDSTKKAIQLQGLEEDVNECTSFIWQTLSRVKESELKFSKAVVSVLGSERGKTFMATGFKNNSIEAIISFDSTSDTHVVVTAMDWNQMNKAVEFIKNAIAEESIPLDTGQKQLLESENWKELKLSIQESMLLLLTEEPATSMLLLVGIKEAVDTAKEEVQRFLQDTIISNRVIEMGNGRAKFLFEYELVSIKKIEESLKKYSVKVTKINGENVGTIMVSGTKEGIAQAVAEIDLLASNVKDRILAIDKQLLRIEDEEKNLLKFLDGVAAKRKFVFERYDEQRGVDEVFLDMPPNKDANELKIQVFAVDEITIQSVEDDIRAFKERKQERLLGNEHRRIDDTNLQKEVKEPEKEVPSDPLKVHVKGLSSATTKDGLELYMEKMSNGEVQNMEFGSYNNALISFKEPIDVNNLEQRIYHDKKGLEGCKPILERVPYCCCIQVSGLDEKTTEDSLILYFENPRKGCGAEPCKVDFQGEGRALVYFDDPSGIISLLNKRHVLEKAKLQMEMFYPFLSEEKLTKIRHIEPKKTAVIDVDPDIMDHITICYIEELHLLLDEAEIELQWTTEEKYVVITEKAGATSRNEPWGKRVKLLQEYFGDFRCEKISVEAGVWDEVLEAVTQQLISSNVFGDTNITTHDSANEIRITGKKDCLHMAVSAVETVVGGIQEDKALQDAIETKVEKDLETGMLALLKMSNLYEDLQAPNKHLKMEVKEEDGELIIKGPRKSLQDISIELYKFFSKVKEEVLELPERILGVLETAKGRDYVVKSLSQNQIQAVLVHGQRKSKNEATVFAINKDQSRQAMKLIESFSTERSIHLKEENIPVMKSQKWNELVMTLEAQSVVSVWFEAQSQTLWISGVKPDALECFSVLKSYINENTILEENVAISDGCSRFLFQRFEDEIRDLHAQLRDAFVKIRPSECGEIKLTGTRDGIAKGKESVMALVQRVCDEEIKIDKPGVKKFFKSSKGAKVVRAIEDENKCTVELVDLDQLEELEAGSSKGIAGFKRLANAELICSYTTMEGKKLIVYKDDLTKHPVDVIVNAANENLQHVGGLARDIVRVGGQGIQDECDSFIKRNGALIEGHVMETGPGHLPCKRIVHAVGPRWDSFRDNRKGGSKSKERILQFTFENCLKNAEKYRSIAIPAVSAGIFGFPLDRCASILVETVIMFFQNNPYCSLSEVHFTNNDDITVKAFSDEMKRQFGKERRFDEGRTKTSIRDQEHEPFLMSSKPSSSENVIITPEGISLFVKVGDISKEIADVLVNTAGEDLNLQNSGCARSFSKAAGPNLQRYCSQISPVEVGNIGVTKPGRLKCKHVFHAVCGDWDSGKGEKILRGILRKCLSVAERKGAHSIAIPAIGTGVLHFPRNVVARLSFEEVVSFSKSRPDSLKEVRFVLYVKDHLTVQAFRDEHFYSQMNEYVGEVPDKIENPGFLRKITNFIGITSEEEREMEIEHNESSEIVLRVYSGQQSHLVAAVEAIREMINENCKRQVILNDAVAHLDQDHQRKIRTLERQFDCNIRVEVAFKRIIVEGNNEDILGALSKIHGILHDVADRVKQRTQAKLLAKDFEWQYQTEDGFIPYSKGSNAKIEFAYKSKEKEITFEEDGEDVRINFSRKTEYSAEGEAKVTRICRSEISLPDYWDPQPTTSSGSEVTVHLVNLERHKDVQEYLKVSDLVKKTLPGSKKIKKIQRVQNPAQYKIYAVRKQRMDEEKGKGSNEKMLFHGIQRESCDSINADGFNRSYGGRNATLYGQGVYFAVNAEFSARSTYSPPDPQGNRYMYLARVLTGEYTVGAQYMHVPPPKNPANPTDRYDTVVDDVANPSIFVAFYDWQCYPEYLITFQ